MRYFLLVLLSSLALAFTASREASSQFLRKSDESDGRDDLETECIEHQCNREELEEVYDFETGLFKEPARDHGYEYELALKCWERFNDNCNDRQLLRDCLRRADVLPVEIITGAVNKPTSLPPHQTTDYDPQMYDDDHDDLYDRK